MLLPWEGGGQNESLVGLRIFGRSPTSWRAGNLEESGTGVFLYKNRNWPSVQIEETKVRVRGNWDGGGRDGGPVRGT